MGTFKVKGGNNLSGVITPQGAKNEALQVISAVLLTDKMVTIDNIPNIIDVNRLIDLLDNLGVTVKKINQNKYSFESKNIDLDYLNSIDFETKAKNRKNYFVTSLTSRSFTRGISLGSIPFLYLAKSGGSIRNSSSFSMFPSF